MFDRFLLQHNTHSAAKVVNFVIVTDVSVVSHSVNPFRCIVLITTCTPCNLLTNRVQNKILKKNPIEPACFFVFSK